MMSTSILRLQHFFLLSVHTLWILSQWNQNLVVVSSFLPNRIEVSSLTQNQHVWWSTRSLFVPPVQHTMMMEYVSFSRKKIFQLCFMHDNNEKFTSFPREREKQKCAAHIHIINKYTHIWPMLQKPLLCNTTMP